MRTVVYSVCYNEEYMLPFFLEHYSFATDIIIYDNHSTDRSVEIMKSYDVQIRKAGAKTHLEEFELAEIKNSRWKEKRNYDLVFIVDIDEFIHPLEFDGQHSIYQPYGYQMLCNELPAHGKPIIEQVKTGAKDSTYDKMCVFNPAKIEEINYAVGCHKANPIGDISIYHEPNLKLFHYNYLTLDYHLNRYKERGKRISAIDREFGHNINYLDDIEVRKQVYDRFQQCVEVLI